MGILSIFQVTNLLMRSLLIFLLNHALALIIFEVVGDPLNSSHDPPLLALFLPLAVVPRGTWLSSGHSPSQLHEPLHHDPLYNI
jgi:hypothetical protein